MKNLNRWVYAVVGVFVLLFAGIIYAWSVLSLPIAQTFPEWTKLQLSMTFTIAMTCFCLSGLLGGIMISRGINVRINVLVSAVLFLIGFFFASRVQTPMQLYLSFGVLVGFASGFSYNAVMSTMTKWFPDKQGLISGVLLMGFGLGSFIIGKVYQAVVPNLANTWRTGFLALGVIIFFVLLLTSAFFVMPEQANSSAVSKKGAERESYTTGQMMKTRSFYFYYLWAILLSAAGLVLVSQASGIVYEVNPLVSSSMSATVVGMISIFNGIGRVIFGNMYDKKGYRFTMLLDIGLFILTAVILIVAISSSQFILVIVGFVMGGFAYGGVTPTNSALVSDFYGPKNYSVNFSVIGSNLIFASFASSIAGYLYDISQSYFSSMVMIIAAAVLGCICLMAIRRPKVHEETRF